MIRLSVLYPKTEGASFDLDYYVNKHVPLCCETWGLDTSTVVIEKGVDGPYEALLHLTFDSLEALGAAMGSPDTGKVIMDVPNYTTIQPVMQTSEVL